MHATFQPGKTRDKGKRARDPFLDRRSGEDRRMLYSLEYFRKGNVERRHSEERRENIERRRGCVRVSQWSSACPDYDDQEWVEGRIDL